MALGCGPTDGPLVGEHTGAMDSVTKDEACTHSSPLTKTELSSALPGVWEGRIFSHYHEADVTFTFGTDGTFTYDHPEDPFGDGPYRGGTSYDILSGQIIAVYGVSKAGLEVLSHLSSVQLSEACELTFIGPGWSLWDDSIQSAWRLEPSTGS